MGVARGAARLRLPGLEAVVVVVDGGGDGGGEIRLSEGGLALICGRREVVLSLIVAPPYRVCVGADAPTVRHGRGGVCVVVADVVIHRVL